MKTILFILLISNLSFGQVATINSNGTRTNLGGDIHHRDRDGWFNYSDSSSVATPIAFTANDTIVITCDGQGGQTDGTYKPYGIVQLFDTINSQFDFSELSLGDEVIIRFNLSVTTSAVNQEFEFYLQCAKGWAYSYRVHDGVFAFKTAGTRQIGITIPIYIGNTQTRDNPTELMFTSDGNATITVNSFYITTKRRTT